MNFALIYELLDEIVVSLRAATPFGYRWCCKVLIYVKKDVASNLHSYRYPPGEDSGLIVKKSLWNERIALFLWPLLMLHWWVHDLINFPWIFFQLSKVVFHIGQTYMKVFPLVWKQCGARYLSGLQRRGKNMSCGWSSMFSSSVVQI